MARRANPTVIGAFVVGAVALAVAGLVIFGGGWWFRDVVTVVMYFDESVNGLSIGAPVAYRGVRLGEVTAIRTEVGQTRIAVFGVLERSQSIEGLKPGRDVREAIREYVRKGLRAQLALQSVVTGQLYVALVARPDTPVSLVSRDPRIPEIPTIPTTLQQLTEALQKVPWERVLQSAQTAVEQLARLVQSPELERAAQNLDGLLVEGRTFVQRLDRQAPPVLASVKETSDTTRRTVEQLAGQLEKTVAQLQTEVSPLLASLRATSDSGRAAMQNADRDLGRTLAELRDRVDEVATALRDTAEAARVTLEQGQSVLLATEGVLSGESRVGYEISQALQGLADTSRSLRALADYLDRHPESILVGKARPGRR
jgi:phospholipid/cholesterol/gamma-HCH transport system substrate-binding protein